MSVYALQSGFCILLDLINLVYLIVFINAYSRTSNS